MTQTVREQVALGRLLPLGGPEDAAWITERAAVRALRRAVGPVPGVRLGDLAVMLDEEPGGTVPDAAPVGALPHVPLRVEADFEIAVASTREPLPLTAERLRQALGHAAVTAIGLTVAVVDLRVTGLLDGPEREPGAAADEADARDEPGAGDEPEWDTAVHHGAAATAAEAARSVPGVRGLTRDPVGLAVQDDGVPPTARHVRIRLATSADHVPLTVARAVAAALTRALAPDSPYPVSPAVLITHVEP